MPCLFVHRAQDARSWLHLAVSYRAALEALPELVLGPPSAVKGVTSGWWFSPSLYRVLVVPLYRMGMVRVVPPGPWLQFPLTGNPPLAS
jgi:hypothetical protein